MEILWWNNTIKWQNSNWIKVNFILYIEFVVQMDMIIDLIGKLELFRISKNSTSKVVVIWLILQ